jgi:hypothetical protein
MSGAQQRGAYARSNSVSIRRSPAQESTNECSYALLPIMNATRSFAEAVHDLR